MPMLRIPNPNQAPTYLFQDYGVLRFLGFTVAQIREGFNEKGVRSPTGEARMRPHHRDTLYHALRHVEIESLERFREAHQRALVEHGLVQGGTFAVDGTGLRHSDRHVVILQQLSGVAPFIVDWRVQGPGQELAAGRDMVAQLQEMIGAENIGWLLMDGAYVDGAWLAALQQQEIGAAVRVYEKMDVFEEMQLLSQYPEHVFAPYRYLRVIQGHKEWHEVEIALCERLEMWPSYRQAWAERSDEPCPGLWGVLIREEREGKDGQLEQIVWGVVFTRPVASRAAGFQLWRQRWGVENRGMRELNQGGWLESQTWGRSEAAVQTSVALKIGAHNCYCLMRTELGQQWAVTGLRSLQQYLYGAPPLVMVVADGEYALLTAEELVTGLGVQVNSLFDLSLGSGED
jgi:hypothetical protein